MKECPRTVPPICTTAISVQSFFGGPNWYDVLSGSRSREGVDLTCNSSHTTKEWKGLSNSCLSMIQQFDPVGELYVNECF